MISRDELSDSRNTLFHGRNKKLSFVLTLALSDTGRLGNDLDRARILLNSFVHFVDPGDVGDFLVVVPQKDMDNVQQELASYQGRLSIVILDETVVAPSLSYYPDTTNDWPRPNKGWYRQQLIKLGAHRLITTPYYMTLDSDVIVKRPLHLDDVFVADRSVVNLENYAHYQSIYLSDVAEYERKVRIERYQDAERVLKLSRPNDRREVWYGETPVILSRDIVCELVAHIQQIWKCPWQDALLKISLGRSTRCISCLRRRPTRFTNITSRADRIRY